MLYSSTLFQVGDAKRLYQLFKKNRVDEYFDKKRVGNLTLYRYLDFSKEGENFISIDIKSKEVGDTLKGDEVVQDGKFFNVLGQKSTGELNSIEWDSVDEKSIEDTKIYIVKNYPHQAKQVSEIQKTEYLYKDKYDNIYFPIFLQKFSEGGDGENREIRNYQTLSPEQRHTILKKRWLEKIAPVLKENSIKLQPLQNFAKLNNPQFLVGNGQIAYKNHYYDLVNSVRKNGFYKNLENIHNIVIVNTVRNFDTTFLQEKLLKTFQEFHLNSNIVSENFINWESSNQHEIEHRIGVKFVEYMKNKYDLTKFIPLIIHHKENSKIYVSIKKALIESGFPSQFISVETINSKLNNSIQNLFFGMVAKFRNLPFVLNREDSSIDYFIGYDVSREKQEKKVRNFSGSTYFFSKNGEFKEVIKFYPEGEKLRGDELKKVFPPKQLQNRVVVVHRDGNRKIEEVRELEQFCKVWNIKMHLVYITKRHTARIFKESKLNPEKGIYLKYMENRAILVTSDSKIGTKKPLKIEYLAINTDPFELEKVLQDILDLTYLNYSSVSDTTLPITTYFSHQISDLIRQGIEPSERLIKLPYWL